MNRTPSETLALSRREKAFITAAIQVKAESERVT